MRDLAAGLSRIGVACSRVLLIAPLGLGLTACGSTPRAANGSSAGPAGASSSKSENESNSASDGASASDASVDPSANASASVGVSVGASANDGANAKAAAEKLVTGRALYEEAQKGSEKKKPYAEAIAALEEAIALDPMLAEAHFYLGRCRAAKDDRVGAIASFEKAIALAPDRTLVYYTELANAEIDAGTPERALAVALDGVKHAAVIRHAADLSEIVATIAREDEALYELFMVCASVYQAMGKKDERIAALLETRTTRSPLVRDADYQLALAYHGKKNQSEACLALVRFSTSPVSKDTTSIDHHRDARVLGKKWGCPPPK